MPSEVLQQVFSTGYFISVYLEVTAWSFALSLLSGYAHLCKSRLLLGGDTHIERAWWSSALPQEEFKRAEIQ